MASQHEAGFENLHPLTDVEVNGKRARGELNGSTVKFRKESGDWKFCTTGIADCCVLDR
jgi:hypothetical protein